MGVPTSEVGYTSATTGRGDHEVQKGYVVALEKNIAYLPKHTMSLLRRAQFLILFYPKVPEIGMPHEYHL
jgi:hypothetical protein